MAVADVNYCLCDGCNHADTHLTEYHYCSICQTYGHGSLECVYPSMIAELAYRAISNKIVISHHSQCNVPNCTQPTTHITDGHWCEACGKFGNHICNRLMILMMPQQSHSPLQIIKDSFIIRCPMCRDHSTVFRQQKVPIGINTEPCIACTSKKASVLLQCGHIVVCMDCAIECAKMTNI